MKSKAKTQKRAKDTGRFRSDHACPECGNLQVNRLAVYCELCGSELMREVPR